MCLTDSKKLKKQLWTKHNPIPSKKSSTSLDFFINYSSVPILSRTHCISDIVNLLHCPSSRSPSIIFSTRIRFSRFTSYSTAATIRRICRFFHSRSVIENFDEERRVISQGFVVYFRVITVSFPSILRTIRVREPLSLSSIRTQFLILSSASSSIFPYTSTTYSFSCS